MSWARLDDQFHLHTKVAPLSDRAWRLHVTAILECARHLTDGRVSRKLVPTWPMAPRGAALRDTIDELIDARLWLPTDDGWDVNDYLEWNPPADAVAERREARKLSGRAGGLRSGVIRREAKPKQTVKQVLPENEANGEASAEAQPQAKTNPVPVPVPVREAATAAPEAAVAGARIRCPVPITVPSDTLASLEQNVGMPAPVALKAILDFSLAWSAKPSDLRFPDAWVGSAVKALTGDWSDTAKRARMRAAAAEVPFVDPAETKRRREAAEAAEIARQRERVRSESGISPASPEATKAAMSTLMAGGTR